MDGVTWLASYYLITHKCSLYTNFTPHEGSSVGISKIACPNAKFTEQNNIAFLGTIVASVTLFQGTVIVMLPTVNCFYSL